MTPVLSSDIALSENERHIIGLVLCQIVKNIHICTAQQADNKTYISIICFYVDNAVSELVSYVPVVNSYIKLS